MTGECRFCHQTMMVETDCQQEADRIATEECKCKEGQEYRNMELMKQQARTNIDALTEDIEELAKVMAKMAVEAIANKACKKVSIKVSERVTINISGSADEISVERKFKEDNKLKANKW